MLSTHARGGASSWLAAVVSTVLTVPDARSSPAPVALAWGALVISMPDVPALTLRPSSSR